MSFPWKRAVPALALSVGAAAATASPAAAELRPEPRHVITRTKRGLVGAGPGGKDIVDPVVEMPLNHVGLVGRRVALEALQLHGPGAHADERRAFRDAAPRRSGAAQHHADGERAGRAPRRDGSPNRGSSHPPPCRAFPRRA
jgi:hypothetical protein